MTQRPSVDDCVRKLGGDPEKFRQILTDKDALLAKVCKYAKRRAAREKCQPWSIIGMIFGHGSGVSSAIYELYRDRSNDE